MQSPGLDYEKRIYFFKESRRIYKRIRMYDKKLPGDVSWIIRNLGD